MLPFGKLPFWCGLTAFLLLFFASTSVQAIPAYARQTGAACADCHAGSYGPALTPYGMRFKLGGYTDTDGKGRKIPLSMQLTESHSAPARGDSSTNLSEGDLYIAGRLTDQFGGYVKIEADHSGHNTYNTRLSNIDLRFVAKELKIGEKDALFGVTVNNSPGFTDPVAVLPAFTRYGPPGVTGTLLNPSSPNNLANRVIGASVYGLYDSNWYGEVGTYRSLPSSTQDHLGYNLNGDPGRLSDTGYLRLAYMKDMKRQFFSAGVVALTTKRQLPRSGSTDDLKDLGYDLTYQYLGNREHIVQVAYVNILEKRDYGSAPVVGGIAARDNGNVHDQVASVAYTFKQAYGISIAHMKSTGSNDVVRYGPSGSPDTTSNLITVFWTPFGRDESYTSIANLKLALNWYRYTRFNGRDSDIFFAPPGGRPTDPADLNTFYITASIAF
ncbi:MAG TPA: cytochrome C [Luteibacter sp.]|nr:cytochrome C [Luteibacter sp.]